MANYQEQAALLLQVLPEIAKEKCFALHGGTAINLFVRNMPRLSVDIDLTYIPKEDRSSTFANIEQSLKNIEHRLKKLDPSIKVVVQAHLLKLQIQNSGASIKIEVNQGMRGLIGETENRELCEKAQEEFDAFCIMPCVPFHQLYGGKICAALDRQHPRDIFDIKYLLENEGSTKEIKTGFMFCLICSKRPLLEMLFPHYLNQEQAYNNQFKGMTLEDFTYEDFCATREKLVKTIHQNLSESDKEFLVNFESATPDWSVYNFSDFPAVQWKLKNIEILKEKNPEKHQAGIINLKQKFEELSC
ncbi:MAG: nucleotidyl transferase AbiEii/AbiGii toxin family protein [Chitinophagales bacterium]